MASTEFCIKWTNYQTNIVNSVGKLRKDDEFVDVTLVCDDKSITAHKVILSACSDYFKQVFKVIFLVESDVQTVFSGMQIVRVPWDHTRKQYYILYFLLSHLCMMGFIGTNKWHIDLQTGVLFTINVAILFTSPQSLRSRQMD